MLGPLPTLFLALAAGALSSMAGEAPKWSVRADVQIVSIPFSSASSLLPKLRLSSTFEAAFEQLQAMIAREEAALLAWPVLWTSGYTRLESGQEFRYPAEYDAPMVPGGLGLSRKDFAPDLSQIPTQIEVRNLGSTITFTAEVAADGKRILVDLSAQFSKLLGLNQIKAGTSSAGVKGSMVLPEFFESKVTTRLLLRNGERRLAGSTLVALPEPHIELFILHATAQRVDSPPRP